MYDNYNYPVGADTPDAPWYDEPAKKDNLKFEVNIKGNIEIYSLSQDSLDNRIKEIKDILEEVSGNIETKIYNTGADEVKITKDFSEIY